MRAWSHARHMPHLIQTVELVGVECTVYSSLHEHELKKVGINPITATDNEKNKATRTSMESFKMILMLENADPKCFRGLWTNIRNDMAKGIDVFPTTQVGTFDLLNHWTTIKKWTNNRNPRQLTQCLGLNGRQFTQTDGGQDGEAVCSMDERYMPHIRCFRCNSNGHYTDHCPTASRTESGGRTPVNTGRTLVQFLVWITQGYQDKVVNRNWILFDSCSSIICANNKEDLRKITICPPGRDIKVFPNGGSVDYEMQGELNILPFKVYYDKNSIANSHCN